MKMIKCLVTFFPPKILVDLFLDISFTMSNVSMDGNDTPRKSLLKDHKEHNSGKFFISVGGFSEVSKKNL